MKKKTLTRLISSLDKDIFNKNTNVFKKFLYMNIKKFKVKQKLKELTNRNMDLSLIISFIHFLNDYGLTEYDIDQKYTVSCSTHHIDNKQYRLSITNKDTKQKLQFDTSMGDIDVTYENIACVYMTTMDKINEILKDEIRDFLINTMILTIKDLTTYYKINILFEDRKMY